MLSRRSFLTGAALSPFVITACGGGGSQAAAQRSAALQWNQALLNAVVAVKPGPPMTSRAIGIVHTAMFDAWANYTVKSVGTQLGAQLRRPQLEATTANKSKAVSYAAYSSLVDLFPTFRSVFDDQMNAMGYDPADLSLNVASPQGIGNLASRALLAYRHSDGSNQLNNYADTTGYVPVNTADSVVDPAKWQQLRFANGASPTYIAPHWGNVTPFALSNSSAMRPPAPPEYGSQEYLSQAQEIVDITANLTDEQKSIAEYWADLGGTVQPPGHWAGVFAQSVSATRGYGLDDDVKLLFILGNAVMDAGIACWECKRYFNTSRPVTAIRALFKGRQIAGYTGPSAGVQMMDGSVWAPYQPANFVSPPFPEYTSGHSSFSAAAAEVLKRYTGSDRFGLSVTLPAGYSSLEPNTPSQPVTLNWPTFTSAADQAGISRRYGGIHFAAGDLNARSCGRLVGAAVWEKAMTYINGF